MSEAIRFGLIGAGSIMRLGHAPNIAASPDTALLAVFDTNLRNAEAIAGQFGGHAFDNLDHMLDSSEIDAVVVATPNCFHEEGVIAAAQRGKHVLCEKPMCLDVASAQRMIDACRQAGVNLQVGFNQRFWAQVEIARALIRSGFIGDVHQFRSMYSEKSTAYPATTRYRYDLRQSGGGTIIDLTVHRIDLVRYLLGEFASVFGELAHSVIPEKVDDNVWLLAQLRSGARGCLSGNRYSPNVGDGTDIFGTEGTIHVAAESINPHNSAPLHVYTEKPLAELPASLRDGHYPDAWWKEFDGGWISLKPPRRDPYACQLADFVAAVRDGRAPLASGEDGLRAQEVIQAAYLSFDSGTWVELPLKGDEPFKIPEYR